ncbi:hypothetical protein, partial [Kitasatospora sp. NPDC057198]|uniref:hypothetical protein n=1 Tax=Kitasatospora sp. NPDC057198 TaxID=3346046 RepID=UPI003624FD0D
RALLAAARLRPREPHEDLLSPEQRAHLGELTAGHPPHPGPNALLPVAQLHLRDVPGLTGPAGTDLLQVLWCPLDHGDEAVPATRLFWRNAADVGELLTDPPEPADVDPFGDYVPEPCVLHPEAVTEYPARLELPEELAGRLRAWGEESSGDDARYQSELSVAPGWKVGGWGPWSFRDPWPMRCPTCAAPYRPLLTVDSAERGDDSWTPLEDRAQPSGPAGAGSPDNPPMVSIGRGYTLQVYVCPASFDHPHLDVMQ